MPGRRVSEGSAGAEKSSWSREGLEQFAPLSSSFQVPRLRPHELHVLTACCSGVPRCLPGPRVSVEFLVSEKMTEEPDFLGQDSDGGSEEVVLTPAELIERLEQAWMNEKFAPELLESKPEIVECVMEQLEHMEENVRRAKREDLKVSIHQMEMERIRYVLSSYLRCRLMKIEKFFPHVLEKEKTRRDGEPSSLSPEELAFTREFMANTETYLKNVALKHMPPNLQKVDLFRAVPKPDLDSYVFLRVRERQENILVEPDTDEQGDYVIDLEKGSQHLIRYKTIAPLVASGAVQLI
nr:DNA replication complex GINS protein SLD5 isoform X1 [Callithrix jacchus]